MKYAIETIDLVKNYQELKKYRDYFLSPFKKKIIPALKGINLKIEEGEFFGLLGPNGAGKTTLIKILTTLVLPNSGKAIVAGYDVEKEGKFVRRSIGFVVSEERSCYWRLTGRQNLEFFATLDNLRGAQAKKKIEEVLELTGLTNDADRFFKDYSTGMKQKLAIARGLLTDPKILFLDEPTKSLDPTTARNLRDFVKKEIVERRGKTVLFATHNLSEAESLCDRIAIIDKGVLKACGSLGEIRKILSKRQRFIIKFEKIEERIIEKLKNISFITDIKIHASSISGEGVCEIELDGTGQEISHVIKELVLIDARLLSFYPVVPSLEDIFSQVTEKEEKT